MLIFHLYHTSHSVDIVVPDFPDFRELNFCITILNNVWLLPAAPSRPHSPIEKRVRRSSTCKSHKRKTAIATVPRKPQELTGYIICSVLSGGSAIEETGTYVVVVTI